MFCKKKLSGEIDLGFNCIAKPIQKPAQFRLETLNREIAET